MSMLNAHRTLLVLAASAALAAGCSKAGDDAAVIDTTAGGDAGAVTTGAASTPTEAELRNFMEEVFNKGNAAAADQWVAENFVDRTPSPGQEPGLAGFKKMVTAMKEGMGDMRIEVQRVILSGDMAVMHVRQTGTHTVSMMGEKPTGNKIDAEGIDLIRFENGKAVEHWGYYQEMKFMQQIGMMPEMPGAPTTQPPADTAAKQ
jgi:predicted ester cyclase